LPGSKELVPNFSQLGFDRVGTVRARRPLPGDANTVTNGSG
jgi:hypothetical protein